MSAGAAPGRVDRRDTLTPLATVRLRRAGAADCEAVFRWNGAPDVRARSRAPRPLDWDEHQRWFAAAVADPEAQLLVLDVLGPAGAAEPVGVVRVGAARPPEVAEVSIALSKTARGRGLGRAALLALCAGATRPLRAEILADNLASLACFRAAGFRERTRRRTDRGDLLVLEWHPHA